MSDHSKVGGGFDGLRVPDPSRVLAGSLCCQLLGDHGATVIKVEPRRGDDTRRWRPPFIADNMSFYFTAINRNRSKLGLGLSKEGGQRVPERLLALPNVVVGNFEPENSRPLGIRRRTLEGEVPKPDLLWDNKIRYQWPYGRQTGAAVAPVYGDNRNDLTSLLARRIANWKRNELADELIRRGIPASAIRHAGEVLQDAGVHHRNMVVETDG